MHQMRNILSLNYMGLSCAEILVLITGSSTLTAGDINVLASFRTNAVHGNE